MVTAASNTLLLFEDIRAVNLSGENIPLYYNTSCYITLYNLCMGHMVTLVVIYL
jgi:hypothetical protein